MNNAKFDATQTTIFDVLSEEERAELLPIEKETKVAPARTKATAAVKPADEPEPDEYEIDRVVYYAGHHHEVPSRTMKLEEVRAWLEETYPELTKDRTELVYDKTNGHIIPVLKGHKKGARPLTVYTEHPENPMPVYHFLDFDGLVWQIRRTQTGLFKTPVYGNETAGVRLELFVPKIPLSVLEEIVNVFKAHPDTEHLAYVVWDSYSGYSVHWPAQSVTAVSVEGAGFMETETQFVVAHIHSHGRLNAFWSSQDNADEIRTGIYGVVGKCDFGLPLALLRYSCAGEYSSVLAEQIFSGDVESVVCTKWA